MIWVSFQIGTSGLMLAACKGHSEHKGLILLQLPWMGRAEWLFRQDCCMNTMKSEHQGNKTPRTAVGIAEPVPLHALLLGIFCMTGFLQVFSVSHCWFWSDPLPVMCSLYSVATGPDFLVLIPEHLPELQWCRFFCC